MFESNLAGLASAWDFLPRRRPHLKPSIFLSDLSRPPKSSGLIWESDGACLAGSPSLIALQKVRDGAPMRWRTPRFPLSQASELCERFASTCCRSEVQRVGGGWKEKEKKKAPESSLNSNSNRLLLCVFVSFRSHLAITGANLWSAPGYSVKMTDSSPPHPYTPASPTTPSPAGRMAFTTPGVPSPTGTRKP